MGLFDFFTIIAADVISRFVYDWLKKVFKDND